jgi:methionyl-tRNA synthetase
LRQRPSVRCRPPSSPRRNAFPNRRQQRILVAVAWPYASGPRHLGHVAGFGVPSDITARYHRLRGDDVLMVSGTDEHGTPVMVAADREGLSPRETADRYSGLIRKDLHDLGLSYDLFTRTTTKNHYRVVQDLFRTVYEHGYITSDLDGLVTRVFDAHGRTILTVENVKDLNHKHDGKY